jgi:hypothetical protein
MPKARSSSPMRAKVYRVRFTVPMRPLEHADIEFKVDDREGQLGTLLVSRGALEWRPYRKQRKHRLTWQKFDDLLYKHHER